MTSSRKTQSGTLPNIQVKSKSKILDRKANRQQIEVNKSEKAAQQVDDQGKSVSDRNKAIENSIKKTLDQAKEAERAVGCGNGGLGC